MTDTPPQLVITEALTQARQSPCCKSKRGVVVWLLHRGKPILLSGGFNAPVAPLICTGSEGCRKLCSQICEHAEMQALRDLITHPNETGLEMLHVKSVDGELVPSGGPSCLKCSPSIARDTRLAGVWLYHADGWRRYTPKEFHRLTLATCKLQ